MSFFIEGTSKYLTAVEHPLMLLIDTLDRHLKHNSIGILINTQSTLYRHFIDSGLIVSQVSANSYKSIKN